MARKKTPAVIKQALAPERKQRGRVDRSAMFPVPPPASEAPPDYAAGLADLKARIQQERLRVVLASNAVMVLLYWDIGRSILDKQADQGWGSRVIDRLAADLREAFPEMKGFSPRNLKYMRAFAAAWPEREIVQHTVAQLSWRQNLALIEKLANSRDRLWYAAKTLEHGWSSNILALQIEAQAHRRRAARHRARRTAAHHLALRPRASRCIHQRRQSTLGWRMVELAWLRQVLAASRAGAFT